MSNFTKNKCPFCGSEGTIFTDSNYSEKVSCTNINCSLHSQFIELKDWDNRPLENELKEQLKLANEKYKKDSIQDLRIFREYLEEEIQNTFVKYIVEKKKYNG